jgi:hypothetical protein
MVMRGAACVRFASCEGQRVASHPRARPAQPGPAALLPAVMTATTARWMTEAAHSTTSPARRSRWWRWRCWRSWRRRWADPATGAGGGQSGRFVGLANFMSYAQSPALLESAVEQRLGVGTGHGGHRCRWRLVFAYALARSCMPFKALLRGITLVPLLAPSLLAAISLIYWFGNQGVLKAWLQALGISRSTARRHRGGRMLCGVPARADDPGDRAQPGRRAPVRSGRRDGHHAARRKFFTITLPGAKYGLISAALVTSRWWSPTSASPR